MSTLREDAAAALRATTRNADLQPDRMTPREIILTALEQLTVFNTKDQATDAIAAALTAAGYQIVPTAELEEMVSLAKDATKTLVEVAESFGMAVPDHVRAMLTASQPDKREDSAT